MTLDQLRPRERARILSIDGGHGLCRRLGQMGMRPGDTIEVDPRGAFRGPCLVRVHGSLVAIGRGIARRILVEPGHSEAREEGRP